MKAQVQCSWEKERLEMLDKLLDNLTLNNTNVKVPPPQIQQYEDSGTIC